MNVNGFTWLLLAFPVYLLAKGRFTAYLSLGKPQPQTGGATGSW